MDATELCYTPATRLAAAIQAKDLSATEVVEACLARMARLNPTLNAYCTIAADGARAAARAADAYAFNLTGQPAISVPAGWTDEGLPIGLQIVGRRHADALVLRTAAAFEAAAPWAHKRPPLD